MIEPFAGTYAMTFRSFALTAALAALSAAPAAVAQTPPQEGPPPAQGAPGGPGAGGGMGGMGGMMLPRTTADVAPWSDRLFARLDANADGAITADELTMLARPEIASRGGGRLRAMISQSDASRDARVTSEEMTAGAQRMFARMDRNSDGQLADDELPRPPQPPRPPAMPMPTPAPMPMPMPEDPTN